MQWNSIVWEEADLLYLPDMVALRQFIPAFRATLMAFLCLKSTKNCYTHIIIDMSFQSIFKGKKKIGIFGNKVENNFFSLEFWSVSVLWNHLNSVLPSSVLGAENVILWFQYSYGNAKRRVQTIRQQLFLYIQVWITLKITNYWHYGHTIYPKYALKLYISHPVIHEVTKSWPRVLYSHSN